MIDGDVSRLRQLRNKALATRAVARHLYSASQWRSDVVLESAACSAWRIARVISGRLVAHPFLDYQRGPSALEVAGHDVAAAWVRLTSVGRERGLRRFGSLMDEFVRQVDDARALTWDLDLGDAFARSSVELRSALSVIECEMGSMRRAHAQPVAAVVGSAPIEGDWPYLAF